MSCFAHDDSLMNGQTGTTKVLIIRLSSIGDIVLTTPVIRAVHQQWPAEVHVLTKKGFVQILSPNPYISKVIPLEKSLGDTIRTLRAERYDLVIDLHKNIRTRLIRILLQRPSMAFRKMNGAKWLMTALHIDRLPRIHLVDRYFQALAHKGIQPDGQGLDYFIDPKDRVHPKEWVNRAYLAVALGAAHATKQIPEEKLVDILNQVDLPIILLGGGNEQTLGDRLVATLTGREVVNLAGRLTLGQSADVIRQASVVLTPDTGMMHIAAAFQKPIISVWGNTIPAFGMYPYLREGSPEGKIWEVGGLGCRPCSKIGHKSCPKGHFRCMKDQPATAIAKSIRAWGESNRIPPQEEL